MSVSPIYIDGMPSASTFSPALTRSPPRAPKYQASRLGSLPVELFSAITDLLLLEDRLCLALTNKAFFSLLAPNPKALIQRCGHHPRGQTKTPRMNFITRISKELPHFYACIECGTLHPWKNFKPPDQWPDTACSELTGCTWPETSCWVGSEFSHYYKINFAHLHLAMRRFRLGPEYGIPVSSFQHLAVQEFFLPEWNLPENFDCDKDDKRVSLLSTDARIYSPVSGSGPFSVPGLILRTQFMALFDSDLLELKKMENVIRTWLRIKFIQRASICNKCDIHDIESGGIISNLKIFNCCKDLLKYTKRRSHRHEKCACGTFVKVQCKITKDDKLCVSITKWEDLGTGLEFHSARLGSPDLDACQRFNQGCQHHVDGGVVQNEDSEHENMGPVISDGDLFDRGCSLLEDENYKRGSYGMNVVIDEKKRRPPWFDPKDSALDDGTFRAWYMSTEYLNEYFSPK